MGIGIAVACAGGTEPPAASRPAAADDEAAAAATPGSLAATATPAQVCRAGCAKVEQCAVELVSGPVASIERCRRECARLDESRREGMAQLNACLAEEDCGSFAACVRAPADATPPVVVAAPQPGPQMTQCEAVCGGYADCSSSTERASPAVAARLEMQCLGRCLAANGSTAEANPVLPCGDREYCADLIECVQTAAPTRAEAGRGPQPTGRRPCEAICDSIMTCQGVSGDSLAAGADALRDECQDYLCASETAGGGRRLATCLSVTDCDELLECLTRL